MNPSESPSDIVFGVTPASRRRTLWAVVIASFFSLLWLGAFSRGVGIFVVLILEAVVVGILFAKSFSPVGTDMVRIGRDGVLLYDPKRKTWRTTPWRLISGVTPLVVQGRHSRSEFLVFRTKALEWKYLLPPGIAPAEEIADAIRVRIAPEAGTPGDAPEAGDFFEVIFGIRLPGTARLVHTEYHAADGSGWWSVKLDREDFLKLKAEAGAVSAWYPLTRDQRFEVGGRRLTGTGYLQGDYALSTGEWESTPALVWDASAGVLHGLLTRSVG